MTRTLFLAVALAALPLVAHAQDPLRQEVQELRAQLTAAEDRALDLARAYDAEKRRMQQEKDALLERLAQRERDLALLRAKVAQLEVKVRSKQSKTTDRTLPAAKAKSKPQAKPAPRDAKDLGLDRRLTVNFDETPISEAVAFIQDITGLNIVLHSSVRRDATVSMRLRDITLSQFFDVLVGSTLDANGDDVDLTWGKRGGIITIRTH